MVGTGPDFITFLEALQTGGAPILKAETVELASRNQVGSLREQDDPGWGFGFLSAVLIDAQRAGAPAHTGTLSWGGVYGHSWFHDPVAQLSVVGLANTALEGSMGSFPGEVQAAIYAVRHAADNRSDAGAGSGRHGSRNDFGSVWGPTSARTATSD